MTFLYDFLTIIKFSFGKILPSLHGSVNVLQSDWKFLQFVNLPAVFRAVSHDRIFQADARGSEYGFAGLADIFAGIGGFTHCKGQHRRVKRGVHEE